MPTRAEIEAAILEAKATLDRLRATGIDGPALWAAERYLDRLLDELPTT